MVLHYSNTVQAVSCLGFEWIDTESMHVDGFVRGASKAGEVGRSREQGEKRTCMATNVSARRTIRIAKLGVTIT